MPSRKIPLLPKFGYSPVKPAELHVSPSTDTPATTPETPPAPKKPSRLTTLPPRSPPPPPHHPTRARRRQQHPRGPSTVPIITTGAFWLAAPHLGDPCTISCLDHLLSCGHKVVTAAPEPCARNCHARSVPDLLQPRDVGASFACTACIVGHLARRHVVRWLDYVGELRGAGGAAVSSGGTGGGGRNTEESKSEAWIAEKLSFVSLAWRDEDVAEFRALYARGKPCLAPWIEPEFRGVVEVGSRKLEGREQRQVLLLVGAGGRASSSTALSDISRPTSPVLTSNSSAGGVAAKGHVGMLSWRSSSSSSVSSWTMGTR